MANTLEEIRDILAETREALLAANKELVSAVKSDKSSTKTNTPDKVGGVNLPNFSSIMPQDMRLIFSQFGNTLKQIFGGTNLSKFENTLKQTVGKLVQSGGGSGFKQALGAAAGASLNNKNFFTDPSVRIGDFTSNTRYGFRGRLINRRWYPNLNTVSGGAFTVDQLAQMTAGGYDPTDNVFKIKDNENVKQFHKRVRRAIKGINGLQGVEAYATQYEMMKGGKWGNTPTDTPHPGNESPTGGINMKDFFTNRHPMFGRMADWMKEKRDQSGLFGSPNLGYFSQSFTKGSNAYAYLAKQAGYGNLASRGAGIIGGVGQVTGISTGISAGSAAWTAARVGGAGLMRAGVAAGGAGLGSAMSGLGAGAAALGLASNPVGWAIAIAAAIPVIAGFSSALYHSQESLKDFNARLAGTYARSELSSIRRSFASANNRATVTSWLGWNTDKLSENLRPIWDFLYNVLGGLLAGLMLIVNAVVWVISGILTKIYDAIMWIWNKIKSLWGGADEPGTDPVVGPFGGLLRDLGKGAGTAGWKEKALFDWGTN